MLHRSRLVVAILVIALISAVVPTFSRVEAAGGIMSYGDVVNGQISNKTYFEFWQFTGSKGDRVQIIMTGDGELDPYLGLLEAESEEVLAEDDDSAGNSNAMIETTLPSSGDFIIVATRYDFDQGTSQGAYTLELGGGSGPQNGPDDPAVNTGQPEMIEEGVYYMGEMTLDTPVAGEITDDAYAQLYALEVEAGTELIVGMFADASNVDAYIIVATEEGDVLAEDDDSGAEVNGVNSDALLALTIEEAGVYFIVATRSGVATGKSEGDYLLLATVPDPSEPQDDPTSNNGMPEGVEYMGDMQIGDTASGALDNTTFVHLYTFDGQAGETVTITMTGDGGLDSYLGLMDPNDEVVAEDDDSAGGTNAQISIRLSESGSYIIIATRNGIDQGTTEGSYEVTLVSGTPAAPEGVSGVGGFGGLPGRAFQQGENTFYLRGFGTSKNPEKSTDLEGFLFPDQALPGRSFNVGAESFTLTGFGKSDDPAKSTPLEAFMGSQQ